MALTSSADIVIFPLLAKPAPREQFIDAMGQEVTGLTFILYNGRAVCQSALELDP